MPKLLQINVDATNGSNGGVAFGINDLAVKLGWETYIAYGRNAIRRDGTNIVPIGGRLNVYWHGFESRLFDNHGLASRVATRRFLKFIEEFKPDIVHLHNIHGYFINYKMLFEYLRAKQIPIVWTLHDCWSFTGHCAHFVSANCEKWKTECHNCPLLREYPKSLFIDRSKKNFLLKKQLYADNPQLHIVAVSQWLGDYAKQSMLKNCDVKVIHNGIDLKVFRPIDFPQSDKFRILGVANMWTKGKGLFDFFQLRELLPVDLFEITLIGLDKDQISTLPEGITGVQRTKSVEELVKYYSESDVFVNLTYADTFPTVNLEALACGTPVITYRTGGSPEAIDEKTGKVVEQGDITAVVNALESMRQLPQSAKMAQRLLCKKRAEDNFEKNACFDRYILLYDSLLQSTEGGGIILGVAATWSDAKGLSDYKKLNELTGNRFIIVLVGINDSIRDQLPEGIIGLPRTGSLEDLIYLYSMADVVTSLSYAESMGMTPIEGMACGTPAIVYDNTAQPELIDEYCGKVVPTGRVDKVYEAILEIVTNGKDHYRRACINRVNKHFNMIDRYSDYFSLYNEIIYRKKC